MAYTERLAQLRVNLVECFDLEELRTLCFDLGVDYDSLRGEGKESKARELLSHLERRGRVRRLIEQCNKLRPNIVWQEILNTVEAESPFKGLDYFDVADADLFFGRETLTAHLVGRLRQDRFLAVVGASGSGKSSVVRAGVVAALRRGEELIDGPGQSVRPPEGSRQWPAHVITPTAHPLKELAASLTRDSESLTATTTLMDDLARDLRSLDLAVSRLLKQSGRGNRLLLVVDQFEELFTACKDEAQRRAFVGNLLHAVAPETEGCAILVIALRADFYAHCAQYASLREALEKHQAYIGPMNADELRRAIEEPARRNGWEFEPGLVDLLLRDVGEEPGALPLLSHALLETWKRRQGRTLTLAGYVESGRTSGAIAKTAETVYQSLGPEQQAIARNIFLRLTELGEGAQDTRRRAQLSELVPRLQDAPAVQAALKTLADARLVVTDRDPARQETVEIVHEALIRSWERLREWMKADRTFRAWQERLRAALRQWETSGRDEGALLRGAPLAEADGWQTERAGELSQAEATFIQAGLALREREAAEREAQRQRELKLAQEKAEAEERRAKEQAQAANRLRTRNQIITAIGALALIAAIIAGVLGRQSESNAQQARQNAATAEAASIRAVEQANIALARQLAAQAQQMLVRQPAWLPRAALLAIESLRRFPTTEANQALGDGLDLMPRELARLSHDDGVTAVAFSPDGQRVASASWDKTVCVWETATGRELARLTHDDMVMAVVFSPDGRWVATASADKTARVWEAVTGRELARLSHDNLVLAVAFSPDGQRVATASDDNTARVWDVSAPLNTGAATGRELARLTHDGPVYAVAFSPDGQRVASASRDETARVWEAATGHELARLSHDNEVVDVAFSPDGQRVATASDDKTARVWDVSAVLNTGATTGRELARLTHDDRVDAVAFSPDGQRVATASWDKTVRVWDVATGRELARLSHDGGVNAAAFSPDGQRVATASDDKTARVWETATGRELARLTHDNGVTAVAFSPDGQRVATASWDMTARVWEEVTGRELARLTHDDIVAAVAFSPDGQRVASASEDKTARVWEAATGRELARLTHDWDVSAVAFSPDGKWVATASWDKTARVWEAATGRELARLMHDGEVHAVAFSPDGLRVATASEDKTARVWDVSAPLNTGAATGRELARLSHDGGVYAVAFSPDGQRVATASEDKTARVWDVSAPLNTGAAAGRELARLTHDDIVWAVAFSPDGQRVASASRDKTARVWDVSAALNTGAATGRELARLTHDGAVWAVAFSPDGLRVASASRDKTARVWEAATGREVARLTHDGGVSAVAFSPDGKWVASASGDKTVRVWEAATGRELACLTHDGGVNAVAFSPDGKWVASASWDKTDRVWLWRDQDLIDLACSRLTRNLTQEEWKQYLPDEPYRKTCPNLPEGE